MPTDEQPLFPQLVTASFTVEELAAIGAGLILFRRAWARKAMDLTPIHPEHALTVKRVADATELMNRIESLTTPDQKREEYRNNG